jgi:hypothetical protein
LTTNRKAVVFGRLGEERSFLVLRYLLGILPGEGFQEGKRSKLFGF